MLNFSAARIYLCLEPTDMRKSFDTLAALVREHLQGDPQSGTWFVFRGKQGNRLKTFCWDRDVLPCETSGKLFQRRPRRSGGVISQVLFAIIGSRFPHGRQAGAQCCSARWLHSMFGA